MSDGASVSSSTFLSMKPSQIVDYDASINERNYPLE